MNTQTETIEPTQGTLELTDLSDLVIHDPSDNSYENFASMWAAESKTDSSKDSLGLDEVMQDENGHDIGAITNEDIEDVTEDTDEDIEFDSIEDELAHTAEEAMQRQITESMEAYQGFANSFGELPEELEFTVGDRTMTKADIVSLTQQDDSIKQVHAALQDQLAKDNAIALQMETQFFQAQTEASKQRQAIEAKLNDPYTPEIEKGALYGQLQNINQRTQLLSQEAHKFASSQAERKANIEQAKVDAVSAQLSKSHSDEKIAAVVSYAQDQGMSLQDLRTTASVGFFESMMKAQAYDELMSKSQSKVAQAKKPKSLKPQARKQAKTVKPNITMDQVPAHKMSDVFHMLED